VHKLLANILLYYILTKRPRLGKNASTSLKLNCNINYKSFADELEVARVNEKDYS